LSPRLVSGEIIALWGLSWLVASIWTRRTAARPSPLAQAVHLAPTLLGAWLMVVASIRAKWTAAAVFAPLWRLPDWAAWLLTAVVLAGVAFTWWARVTLGDLWSSSVVRKEGHALVERGPYRLVRHPIYTGLIAALLAYAVQLASPLALAGAPLVALGFSLKARLEERFLAAGLGEETYAAYRKRTPMLIPFWPFG